MAKKKPAKKETLKSPMYLVVTRHEMDDLPLFVSENKFLAIGFASGCDPFGTKAARKAMNTDCSTPVCVVVLEFVDGEPTEIVYQRDV